MKKQFTYIAAAFLFAGMLSAQKIDINAMPKPGPTPAINIAQPKTFQLSNGLTVMVVENNKLPRVNTTLSMDRPPYYEGNIAGVSHLMAEQLDNGTTNLSKDEFNKKVDFLGANISFSSTGATSNSLSKYFPEVLGLMADAIVNPKFSAEEIQNAKERIIEGLKADEKNASSIASKVSNALIYGKNTSRGEFETVESINKIQLADVQNIYNKYYTPDNAYLVIVGDVKFDQVKPLIEKAFGNWKKSNTKFTALEPASNLSKTEVNVVDVPTAVQSVLSVSNLNSLKMKDPNYFPATIANYILGGGGEARLFMNLREKNGFTYGAYSSMTASKYSPEFSAETSVRNEVTDKAVKELMNELNAISTVKPEELENAKAKLKGSFIMSLEKPETIARFAVNQKIQNLPSDFYTNYLKSIDKVTAADVSNAVKTTILPNQSRIFIAGKASDISEGLEKLGYPVKYFDKEANPVAKPAAQKVDTSVTIASVADKYINAIGGLAAVQKVTSITADATTKLQGMDMSMKLTQAKGGKMAMDMKMMGNTIQKIIFDGKDGYAETQGQKIPLNDKQKASMAEPELFPELTFAKSSDFKLAGIEKYNNEDSYVIKGAKQTYYYSVKTGLKTGEIKMGEGGAIPTSFADYKDVSGVKFPFTIIQNMGGMEINMTVQSYVLNQAKDSDFK
ncbi:MULTISPECIES: M16 family metallopeptidase [Chryseobacterium]|uniref:Zn-dependent peptidase n=1 Tax=Chryseobacterium rhizosphaerae TaxID=395937 RepID=A0AAE4C5W8_9FLAO|nr:MULTISPECIES: pitrilysin family protein [Chryseobacterium]MDC8101437.1 insulinase family protein [Chryseobacterium rhizosphaerae]MDR6528065.1 putative Zn-dependent peptidase [Chryseobacterium rhizosphaerae]